MSIRLRLTAWYSGILALVLFIFGLGIYGLVHYNTYHEIEIQIQNMGESLIDQMNLDPFSSQLNVKPDAATQSKLGDAQYYVQINDYRTGQSFITSNLKDSNLRFNVPQADQAAAEKGVHKIKFNGYPAMMYQTPLYATGEDQVIAYLQVAQFTTSQDRLMDRLQYILVYGSLIAVVLAASTGLFLARKSMRPLVKVIEAANQIQSGDDLSVRIEYDGPPDEIGSLIGTVNLMLERTEGFYKNLENAYAKQRRFVSDASHELRTPLTTIRGNVDFLKKMWASDQSERPNLDEETLRAMSMEAIDDMADEGKRMSRLVNDMLSLARADTGQTIDKEPVPLEIVVKEVARRAQFLEHSAEWRVGDFSVLNGVYVNGSKDYLQQMLFIFIENAFKYTPEGHVTFDAVLYKGQVGLRVSDTGIGMDKDEVPYIFDRFYRADESRGATEGIGLGLSIAKWIIEEHKGSVEVVTRRGEGTTFIIWLPASFSAPVE
ncbi:HAMP domain-containing sensor histidine kinase [Paenibacillus sp. JX-17]|uniref:histidine kinase n=1 Tax=Paenibacillus lacisoli TaxID=3064525 RepID=A0ABT9CHF1_9BACL|nr:HAMP domain-containing sensor histidine kinase [Paenibacillus sp. JX-17]MDO7907362.1 HAMP domain-containing sensor histidine kinase [Paenibacillus sp. JX-17]